MIKAKKLKYFTVIAAILLISFINGVCFASMSEIESNDSFATATLIPQNYDLNQPISGSISSSSDVDYFKFTPSNSGGYHIYITGDPYSTSVYGYLYNSSQVQIDGMVVGDDKPAEGVHSSWARKLIGEFKANETYYIKIIPGSSTDVTDYTITIDPVRMPNDEFESNNTFATANVLKNHSYAEPTTAAINKSGDVDYFKFTPTTSTNYTIQSLGSIDTYAYLYDSSMNQYASDDNNGVDNNFKIVCYLHAYKTYYIKVGHISGTATGNYSIKVTPSETIGTDSVGNNISSAYTYPGIPFGTQIEYVNDVDYYKFTTGAAGFYTFESKSIYNTYGEVYSSSQTLIASDDNSGYEENFRITLNCSANTTYYIKVGCHNGDNGSYSISVFRGKILPVNLYSQQPYDQLCWATAASMTKSFFTGIDTDRTLEYAHYVNSSPYPIIFNKGQYLSQIDMAVLRDTENMTCRNFYPEGLEELRVPFEDIAVIIDNSSPMPILTGGHVLLVVGYAYQSDGADGKFIILNDPWDGKQYVYDYNYFNFKECSYYLNVPEANTEIEPNSGFSTSNGLPLNTSLSCSISYAGDVDYFTFRPLMSGTYSIETTGSIDTYGCLYDNLRNYITEDDNSGMDNNFKITYNLVGGRTYYIKINHKNVSGTGSYTLKYAAQ